MRKGVRGWEKVAAGCEGLAFVAILYTGVKDNEYGLSLAQRKALFVGIMNSIDKGIQSFSVTAASFAVGGLCLMHHWGLGWGTGNTGDDYAYMVLAHRSIALRCAFCKCDKKGTCIA